MNGSSLSEDVVEVKMVTSLLNPLDIATEHSFPPLVEDGLENLTSAFKSLSNDIFAVWTMSALVRRSADPCTVRDRFPVTRAVCYCAHHACNHRSWGSFSTGDASLFQSHAELLNANAGRRV